MAPFKQIARLAAVLLLSVSAVAQADERLRPFVLASVSTTSVDAVTEDTKLALESAGFEVLADYAALTDARVLVISSPLLRDVAAQTELGGFAAVLRAAVTRSGDETQVSYVNPLYLAQAYRLDDTLQAVTDTLSGALGAEQAFGSKRGLTPKKLRKYHYMFGMEYFDDTYALASFDTQDMAVETVAARLADNELGLGEVYRLELPEQGAVLFGVSMAPEGEDNRYFSDRYQMSIVDFDDLRSTAYLPYELLVKDGKVEALHMRFRMAVHFPDLSMMGKHSFMTLQPSPKAIEKALKAIAAPAN